MHLRSAECFGLPTRYVHGRIPGCKRLWGSTPAEAQPIFPGRIQCGFPVVAATSFGAVQCDPPVERGTLHAGGARPPTAAIVDYIGSQRESMAVEPIWTVSTDAGVPIAPLTSYAHRAAPFIPVVFREAKQRDALVDLWRGQLGRSMRPQALAGRLARWPGRWMRPGRLADGRGAGSIGPVSGALDRALCESAVGLFKTEAMHLRTSTWNNRRALKPPARSLVYWPYKSSPSPRSSR